MYESNKFKLAVVIFTNKGSSGLMKAPKNLEKNKTFKQNETLTLIRLGFLKVVFPGGVNLTTPSYFKKNLSNFNTTLYNC